MDRDALTAAEQDALLRRPFDHYARYRLAADMVLATVGPTARVLDLGGGPGSLQAFLPRARVVSSDIVAPGAWHETAPSLVVADGALLPFRDDTFDAVVSLDTLEHVEPAKRTAFLGEVARVARGWALVVCPFDTPGVADADAALLAYVRRRFAGDLPTIGILEEHLGYGHPDLMASREQLLAHGSVEVVPSGRLDRWLAWMLAFFHLLALADDEPVEVTQRVINRMVAPHDLVEPAYRHGLVLRLTGADGPSAADVVAGLTARSDELPGPDGSDVLQVVLTEALGEALSSARGEMAQLQADLTAMTARWEMTDAAERQTRAHAEGLEAARVADGERMAALESELAELRAWRERVRSHPLMRLRDGVRSLVRRRHDGS